MTLDWIVVYWAPYWVKSGAVWLVVLLLMSACLGSPSLPQQTAVAGPGGQLQPAGLPCACMTWFGTAEYGQLMLSWQAQLPLRLVHRYGDEVSQSPTECAAVPIQVILALSGPPGCGRMQTWLWPDSGAVPAMPGKLVQTAIHCS